MAGLLTAAPASAATARTPAPVMTGVPGAVKQVAGRAAVSSYTVQPGDDLTGIAQSHCPSPSDWTGLYEANRQIIGPDPNLIVKGQTLTLDCYTTAVTVADIRPAQPAWWHAVHENHLTQENAPRSDPPAQEPSAPVQTYQAPVQRSQPTVSTAGDGGYQQCVIEHESGGNPTVVNPKSGAGGLYQFLPSTWASLGYSGLPQDAPVSEQTQAFEREYAEEGRSPWMTDGC